MKNILFLFLCGIPFFGFSQVTQVEATTGVYKSGITQISSFQASPKLGLNFNTLAFFQKFHSEDDKFLDEAGFKLSLMKKIKPRFYIGPSIYYNSIAGVMESVAFSFVKVESNYSIIIVPSFGYSNKQKTVLGEVYIQGEYSVPLAKEWQFVSYLQLLTNWINLKTHDRSFQKIRIGVSKNNWQFGAAFDFDLYGPSPLSRPTIGVFSRKIIFH